VKQVPSRQICLLLLLAGLLFDLFLDPEDLGYKFLRNFILLSTDCTVSHLGNYNSSDKA
jgi:hypothetical protein